MGQLLVDENLDENSECQVLVSGWNRILEDGTGVPIALPSNCKAERNEEVIIETILPQKIDYNICICQRSSQQDMEIYIDGKLRHRYTTDGKRLFGKNSMSSYVFVDLKPEDSGKTLQIRTVSDSRFSGRLNSVYYGEEMVIWRYLFRVYGSGTVVAICAVFFSVIAIIGSSCVQILYRRRISLIYLSWGIFLVSFWILSESRLRQLIVANNTIMGTMAYAMVMLIPIPFLFYMDDIQEKRYHKIYISTASVSILIFVINTFLQLSGFMDFLDTLWIANIQMVLGIVFVIITVLIDYFKMGRLEYEIILAAFLILFVAGILENILTYVETYQSHGTVIGSGLIIALIMGAISTGRENRKIEEERRIALATNQLKTEFLIDVSKKIRMPVNTMMGMNEKIIREEKDQRIKEYAVGVRRIGNTLQTMIDEILDYSLVDSNKLNMIETNYNIYTLLNEIAVESNDKCRKKNLEFKMDLSSELPKILYGDEIRIRQILMNIINTVVRYTDEGSIELRVTGSYMEMTSAREQGYELMFIMNGRGMSLKDSDVAKLYKSFINYKNRADSSEGLDLGLSISKSLVDRMRGEFRVQSIYGNGTKFIIRIPQLIQEREPEIELKTISEVEETDEKMPMLLINVEKAKSYCEDDKTFLRVLKMYCKKAEEQQKQLREALDQNDLKQYQLVLHSMKSSAITIAADGLCDLIVTQENMVRRGEWTQVKINHKIFSQYFLSVLDETAKIAETMEKNRE